MLAVLRVRGKFDQAGNELKLVTINRAWRCTGALLSQDRIHINIIARHYLARPQSLALRRAGGATRLSEMTKARLRLDPLCEGLDTLAAAVRTRRCPIQASARPRFW